MTIANFQLFVTVAVEIQLLKILDNGLDNIEAQCLMILIEIPPLPGEEVGFNWLISINTSSAFVAWKEKVELTLIFSNSFKSRKISSMYLSQSPLRLSAW